MINFFTKFADEGFDEGDDDDSEDEDPATAYGGTGGQDGKQMPVMWHQTLLTLVQCYRPYLTPANCLKLKALVKVH